MNTLLARAACGSLIGIIAGASIAGLQAQNASASCGILTWSQADQQHSVLPCTAPTSQSPDGKATCGIATWSQADQKHAVLPCNAASEANGKDACTLRVWSQAEQKYVISSCDSSGNSGMTAPTHFGD